MNKTELINQIAESADISKAAAGNVLNGITDAITDSLQKGENVTLIGFGTFSSVKRNARTGRNPQTGKPMKIPAKTVVKFKAGKKLSDTVK
ncbi:MAG: HU family DNA-binding protein [Desulfobulbaceae bacterium]|uniref:HU family DNA-binding protein n=1 Tax=Candidatus Desulfobia pelagia TaxID=2841692 RepID=A0A8J6NGT5_9BACT|nr:HU family DNA-binding protein [Candidatus Desulfobia pelagia]